MGFDIQPMTVADHDEAVALWRAWAVRFWRRTGWDERTDLHLFSHGISEREAAEGAAGEGPRAG